MKKKIFVVVILFVTLISVFPQTEDNFTVVLTDDYTGAKITRYNGQSISALQIPETIQGFPVKEIGNGVFANKNFTSVVLPSTIEKIGEDAFYNCYNLSVVTIPANVVSIEFVTKSVSRNGRQENTAAFERCNNLLFSSQSVLKLRGYPNNFDSKKLGNYIVTLTRDSTGLVIVRYDNGKPRILNNYYQAQNQREENITIPSIFEGMPVKEIGQNSFFRMPRSYSNVWPDLLLDGMVFILGNLTIPEGVEIIRKNAFGVINSSDYSVQGGQAFKSVTLPMSLKIIEEEAFVFCGNLNNIIIPTGVTTIGNSAFYGCDSLIQVTIPSNIRIIGNRAFSSCKKLSSVIIPEGITEIGDNAFAGCSSLTSIVLPSTLNKIGNEAFRDTKFPLSIQAELRRKGYTGSF